MHCAVLPNRKWLETIFFKVLLTVASFYWKLECFISFKRQECCMISRNPASTPLRFPYVMYKCAVSFYLIRLFALFTEHLQPKPCVKPLVTVIRCKSNNYIQCKIVTVRKTLKLIY